jgi:LysR family pca operon transcriptional activator
VHQSPYGFIREMLLATDLISVMPRLMMAGDLLRGALRVVPLPIPALDRPAGLILPRDRALPQAGRAFVECLRAHVAEVMQRGLTPITGGNNEGRASDTTGPGEGGY